MSKLMKPTPTLDESIKMRLAAGAVVSLVIEADEQLAMAACQKAAEQCGCGTPQVFSFLGAPGDDEDILSKITKHRNKGSGVIVVSDLLRAMGTNPMAWRVIREMALSMRQQSPEQKARLILVETPGVEVPLAIRGDIEYIIAKLPSIDELKLELDGFLKSTGIKLDGNGETKAAIAQALAGLPRHSASKLLGRCFVENGSLDQVWLRNAKAALVKEQSGKALTFIDTESVPLLGGAELMQEWMDRKNKTFSSQAAREFGASDPKGMVLVGVPGTGKSLTPKNIGRKWGLPLIRFDVGSVFGSLVGQSEAQMDAALEAIEACSPCVLWVDEIEKALGGKGGSSGDSGTSDRVVAKFLTWMQDRKNAVFIVATANSITGLRPELLRKGRIDEIFFVDLPDLTEREAIAKIHLERRSRPKNGLAKVVAKDVALVCEGFSGAEIEQAIAESIDKAFAEGIREVTLEDIKSSVKETTPLSVTMSKDIDALRDWAKTNTRPANRRTGVAETKGGTVVRNTFITTFNKDDKKGESK